jgi:dTDP-4-dehydrorhamnose 3,5-epimerase
MPLERDVQTVSPAGEQLARLPERMLVRDLITHTDERGTVCELYDSRWGVSPEALVFAYIFTIRSGWRRGGESTVSTTTATRL